MHRKREFGADSHHDVVKNERAGGVELYLYDLLIGDAETLCILGSHMYVTLCYDAALGDLYLTCGADELHTGSSGNVAALADGRRDAERACVGKRKLDLVLRSFGSQHAGRKAALGTDDSQLFVGRGKLTGLAQHLLGRENSALAVKNGNSFMRQVDMPRGGFDDKCFIHVLLLELDRGRKRRPVLSFRFGQDLPEVMP